MKLGKSITEHYAETAILLFVLYTIDQYHVMMLKASHVYSKMIIKIDRDAEGIECLYK